MKTVNRLIWEEIMSKDPNPEADALQARLDSIATFEPTPGLGDPYEQIAAHARRVARDEEKSNPYPDSCGHCGATFTAGYRCPNCSGP